MKKVLALSMLACLAAVPVKAAPFWYDVITNYPGGCISTNSAGLWFAHPPGSVTATDALIVTNTYTSGAADSGKRLRINGLNSEYVMRLFDPVNTNSVMDGFVYASFIANANFVPSAGQGTYFATLNGVYPYGPPDGTSATNSFQFRGRVYEIGNTNVWPYTTTVPLTYRFGVANAAGDPAQGGSASITYVPIDLIKNVDYQVVLKYDIDNAVAYVGVNPASDSDVADANWSGPTSDIGAITNGLAGLLFRQRTGGGTVDIRDVVVGTTFADVMTNTPGPVLIATNYNTVSTYAGNPALLEVFATSIGGGELDYQWYQIVPGVSTNAVGGDSQTYLIPSVSGSDAGYYFCAVTNSGGLGALSSTNFQITVNTTPTPPGFTTKPPATLNGAVGGSFTLNCVAFGNGPLSYQWAFNGIPLVDGAPVTGNPGDVSKVQGAQTPTLTVTGLSTNETGNYTVTVTGSVSPATNATTALTITLPQAVSIAYLRSLEDPNTWQATNTTSLFTVTGVVTMYTNVVGSGNTSFYIQDATGGIDFFLTANATFRPQMGDIVTATGTLSMFNNTVELVANNPAYPAAGFANVGHTNVLPAPYVFSLDLTNNPAFMETNIEGRICMLTNVWFTLPTIPATVSGNFNTYVTNASGGPPFNVFFPGNTDPDVQGKVLSTRFAYTITGVMAQFVSGSYANRYELYVTRIGDVQTNPPPAVTATATVSGNDVILNWPAVPYTIDTRGAYSYSVLSATDAAGPYVPLATGMAFNTTNGVYTDTNALLGAQKFYRISSP